MVMVEYLRSLLFFVSPGQERLVMVEKMRAVARTGSGPRTNGKEIGDGVVPFELEYGKEIWDGVVPLELEYGRRFGMVLCLWD